MPKLLAIESCSFCSWCISGTEMPFCQLTKKQLEIHELYCEIPKECPLPDAQEKQNG